MTAHNRLSDSACRAAKPSADGKGRSLADGGGLFLRVSPAGRTAGGSVPAMATSDRHGKPGVRRLWRFDYSHEGKRRSLSLGTYPEVSLSEARERRDAARRLLRDGLDPVQARQNEQAAAAVDNSLQSVAEEWLLRQSNWADSHRNKVELRLRNDAFPVIGALDLEELTPGVVLACLRRVEARGAIDSAHRLKHSLGQIFRYAVATDRLASDPTRDLRGALTTVQQQSYPHITDPMRLGEVLRAIDGYGGSFVVKCALQILPHVFVRPGELRGARWDEIDLASATWTIPAARMKRSNNGNHTVPLSRQVRSILEGLHELTGAGELLFPGIRSAARPISDGTLCAGLRRLDVPQTEHVAHGWRHTASTMLNERKGVDPDLIEVQLHHMGAGVRAKYNGAKYMDQRREMLQGWSDYLDGLKLGATVIELAAQR